VVTPFSFDLLIGVPRVGPAWIRLLMGTATGRAARRLTPTLLMAMRHACR
jgi:hypothetical protein